jgi:uncharacterized protein (DUF1015 family)
MANVKPFLCIRPKEQIAHRVAALPYDVYNRQEAEQEIIREPMSFLKIDRPETNFTKEVDTYDPIVYTKAKELLMQMQEEGILKTDDSPCYYIYELIMNGRSQTGLVACASIDDYLNNVIKKHENTREEKELDRIRHVDICDMQTGPIFLAYRAHKTISDTVTETKKEPPIYHFVSADGISHNVWKLDLPERIKVVCEAFVEVGSVYIADGHHRAASAVKVGLKRRADNPGYTGEEEFNHFLSVLFPHDQLMIMPYNRAVKDLHGLSKEEFLIRVKENFAVEYVGEMPFAPEEKATFGMYLKDGWYSLTVKDHLKAIQDPVAALDVSLLQDYLLRPVLGIEDPRIDNRIDFIGGIRGLKELERRVAEDMVVAFSMFPTSIEELFAVSDAGKLMPPKSTWFEPKLRSGLFLHPLSNTGWLRK